MHEIAGDAIHVEMIGNTASAKPLLVALPGALLDGPSAALERIAERRPVMIVRYGRLRRMSELVDAIAGAIRERGFESADLIGSSFGGWVAQCVARRRPDRVRRLVLAHTFALRASDAWRFRLGIKLWRWVPGSLLRALIGLRLRRALAPLRRERARYAATVAHVETALGAPGGLDALRSQNVCMLDSVTDSALPAHDSPVGRPVLILESTDDPLLRPADRQRLCAQYPEAEVHRFTGSGHVTALVEPALYADVVERFLDGSR